MGLKFTFRRVSCLYDKRFKASDLSAFAGLQASHDGPDVNFPPD